MTVKKNGRGGKVKTISGVDLDLNKFHLMSMSRKIEIKLGRGGGPGDPLLPPSRAG